MIYWIYKEWRDKVNKEVGDILINKLIRNMKFKAKDIVQGNVTDAKFKIEGFVGDVAIISCAEPNNNTTHTMHINTLERCYKIVKAHTEPFVPRMYDNFYCADITMPKLYSIHCKGAFNSDFIEHVVKLGLCYKTSDEAIARAKELLEKLM